MTTALTLTGTAQPSRSGRDRLDFVSSAEPSPTGAFYTHLVWKRAN